MIILYKIALYIIHVLHIEKLYLIENTANLQDKTAKIVEPKL